MFVQSPLLHFCQNIFGLDLTQSIREAMATDTMQYFLEVWIIRELYLLQHLVSKSRESNRVINSFRHFYFPERE